MYEEFDFISHPVSGTGDVNVKRTPELKMMLRNFLAQCGASCCEDENNKDVLKCYSRLQSGMYVEQEIHVGESDYVCYTNLSGQTKAVDPVAVASLILAANDVNRELRYGNFEVNGESGALRFRSYYEPGCEIRMEALDRLVGEPLWAIETYAHMLS